MIKLKNILFFTILLFSFHNAKSQDFVYDWVRNAGGERWDLATDLIIDQDKNVYMTGGFEKIAYFGNDSIISSGNRDIFIAKYDSTGNLIWLKTAGGKQYDSPGDLEFDSEGNLLLVGNFQDTALFENQSVICSAYTNCFLAKYSQDGNLLQLKSFNAETGASKLFITPADSACFFISGSFNEAMDIDGDSLTATGKSDLFTACFTNDFTKQNLYKLGGYGKDKLKDIKYYNHKLYLACDFTDSIEINDSLIYSYGYNDVLILETDTNGNILQSKAIQGFGENRACSILTTSDSSIYISGEFKNKIYTENDSLISNGGQDLYLIKYNADFQNIQTTQIGGKRDEYANTLLTNTVNAVYLTGSFTDTLTLASKTIVSEQHTADMFMAKFTPEGENIGLKQAGGSGYEYGNKLINDENNYLYIIGNFAYDFAFETDSISSDSIFGADNDDIFIARFYDCDYARYPDIGNDTSFCGYGTLQVKNSQSSNGGIFGRYKKYIWNNGHRGRYLNVYDSGYYYVTTIDNHKCLVKSDSIFASVFPVPEPDLGDDIHTTPEQTIVLNGGTFETYLWSNDSVTQTLTVNTEELPDYINTFTLSVSNIYDCYGEDDINIYVEGASYAAGNSNQNQSEQNYYCNSEENNTSEQIPPLESLGTETGKELIQTSALVYPNPNKGHFYVNLNNVKEKVSSLKIYTEEGRKVYEQNNFNSGNPELNLKSKGSHFLIIETLNHIFFEKIIIQ